MAFGELLSLKTALYLCSNVFYTNFADELSIKTLNINQNTISYEN